MSRSMVELHSRTPAGPLTARAEPADAGASGGGSSRAPAKTDWYQRFERLARLYGAASLDRLAAAHVVVFGVGGVGSFAAEALARSAIGNLLLVDFDTVALSNTNRQLQALADNAGMPKAVVLRDRLRLVNPDARIEATLTRYDAASAETLLRPPWPNAARWDFVLDCIDHVSIKAHLLASCRAHGLPVVSSMGAGGKTDPTRIRIADLGTTSVCRLAHQLRKTLRQKLGFPRPPAPLGIIAVYSEEPRRWPQPSGVEVASAPPIGGPEGGVERPTRERHLVDGTAAFVTGAFGLACASQIVNSLVRHLTPEPAAPQPISA